MPESPNVLILMVDQQRYDACGCYGSRICQTPTLDRLAESGTKFTRAYTSLPLCSPTPTTFWTGLWSNHNGILINTHWTNSPSPALGRLNDDIPILPEIFRATGYSTAHFGKWHVGPDAEIARRGFDHVVTAREFHDRRQSNDTQPEIDDLITRNYIYKNYQFSGITSAEGEDFLDIWLCRRAEEWLRANATKDQPFFCCVSTFGPHPGYVVPASISALYNPCEMPLWPSYEDDLSDKPHVHRWFRDVVTESGSLSPDEWRTCLARYYAFVTLIDAEYGRLVDLLDELGVSENTIVVFVTDHGDLIGSHRLWDKGPMLYEDQIHIPLVVHWPGVTAPGTTCGEMVSLLDMMPTLVEAAGLSLPQPVDGRSVVPLLRGEPVEDWPDDVYIQYNGEGISLYSIRAIRSRRYKYAYYPFDKDELYDEEADPWEMHNLVDEPSAQPILAEMKERMARWMEQVGDVMIEWNIGVTEPEERFRRFR